MKRLLLLACLGIFASSNAFADVVIINDYLRKLKANANNLPFQDNASSCETIGGLSAHPGGNKECNTVTRGAQTCYTNCHCPDQYSESCSGSDVEGVGGTCDGKYISCKCTENYTNCSSPSIGIGEPCTADGGQKYASCECPANYSQTCAGAGEVGVGDACQGLYRACTCASSYRTCINNNGVGNACTADGGQKFAECADYDGSSCRAVTDATPYYNSAEYIQHANAFRGIENTQALINAYGTEAAAASLANAFYPNNVTSKKCNMDPDNEYFGAGKWYLPSLGEMLYFTGTDFNSMTSIYDQSHLTGDNVLIIANTLNLLYSKSGNAEGYSSRLTYSASSNDHAYQSDFWTSSEGTNGHPYAWFYKGDNGITHHGFHIPVYNAGKWNYRTVTARVDKHSVRPALMLQHCFDSANISVGDVLFSNMTVKSIDNYTKTYGNDCNHYPIGVIYWISPDKTLVRVISALIAQHGASSTNTSNLIFDPSKGRGNENTTIPFYKSSDLYENSSNDVTAISNDVWGCSSINNNCIPSSDLRIRHSAVCTPDDGSTEFAQYANAFRGREYTDAIIAQHGSQAQAAYAVSQFYPRLSFSDNKDSLKNDPYFGQGKWYLPSAGEALYLSGVDFSAMSSITDTAGITNDTLNAVEAILVSGGTRSETKPQYSTIKTYSAGISSGTSAATNSSAPDIGGTPRIWTSSEASATEAYYWDSADGAVKIADKQNPGMRISVRPVTMLRDPDFLGDEPKVGDKVSGTFRNTFSGGLPREAEYKSYPGEIIGVIYWVSPDKRTVRIVSRQTIDLLASGYNTNTGYNNRSAALWLNTTATPVDIEAIPNNIWDSVPVGQSLVFGDLHDGRKNTQAAVDQIGANALIPYVATQFYAPGVAADDANFGQGKWYVPAIGEWMDLYGYNWNAVAEYVSEHGYYEGNSAAIGDNFATVNAALTKLGSSVATTAVSMDKFATSSEYSNRNGLMVSFDSNNGGVFGSEHGGFTKPTSVKLRVSALLENRFRLNAVKPVVGDVMYADLSYGSADEYDGSKTAVGVVYWVSSDGNSARIINLKNLTVKKIDGAAGYEYTFNPNIPYTQNASLFPWEWHNGISDGINVITSTDITGIKDLRNNWASSLSNRNAGTSFVPPCPENSQSQSGEWGGLNGNPFDGGHIIN